MNILIKLENNIHFKKHVFLFRHFNFFYNLRANIDVIKSQEFRSSYLKNRSKLFVYNYKLKFFPLMPILIYY